MVKYVLWVGLGGALGAMARFSIGLIPNRLNFPLITLLINLLGAIAIGFIVGTATSQGWSKEVLLFWQTGFCGGFTTFSTFSFEAVFLLQHKSYGACVCYVLLSVLLCIFGVMAGQLLASEISRS